MSGPRRSAPPASPLDTLQEVMQTQPVVADYEEGEVDHDLVRELTHTEERRRSEPRGSLEPGDGTVPEVASPPTLSPAAAHWEELIQRLQWEAAATTSGRRAAVLLHELGRIYEDQLERPDQALEAYRESHDRHPALPTNCRALTRLLARRGDYAACLPVLQEELGAISAVEERVAVLTERALLQLDRLADLEGARADLLRAHKMDPDDPLVEAALAEVFRRTRELDQLEQLLRRQARRCEHPELVSGIQSEMARIREQHFNDTEGAATLYRTALNTCPSNLHALQALLRTARINRDYPAVARLCEAMAEVTAGPAAAAALWSAARIYRDRLRNADLACGALEQACEHAPEDRALLVELADLYERGKKWEPLARALESAANLSGDTAESAVLFARLGQVRLQRLHDPEGAIEALRQAITLCPEHVPARRTLGRLYARQDRHDELPGLLSDELEIYTDPGRRASISYRIGSLYEHRLGDLEQAAAAYAQALAEQAGFRPAVRGLSRVYDRLERHEDLISLTEQELAGATSREDRILLLRRISAIWERKLEDPAAALSAYERMVAVEPSNLPALRALRRLYAMGGRWRDMVGVLKTDADQAMDRWRRVGLLTEAAEVQELQLQDADGALQTYLEVLDLAPTHQPALMAAGRLLHRAGRHDDLLQLHRQELEHVEDPLRRAWLLMKVGRVSLERLGRPEEAARAYEECLGLYGLEADGAAGGPADAALDQLVQIYRATGSYPALLQVLQRAPVPESGRARSLHHRRIAEVLQHGQRPALAVEHLRRAIEASRDDASLYQLARIYATIGDRQGLISLYRREAEMLDDPLGLEAVYHKLARLLSEAEEDLEAAVEVQERILELDPRNRVALHQLEQLLPRLDRWSELAAALELTREPSDDMDYRTACAIEVAALKEDRLGDLQGAAHASFEVLERHPTHPEALATLERHYRASENTAGLVQVLGRQLKVAQSTGEQAAILSAMGAVHAGRGELSEAHEIFKMALELVPTCLPAARGWVRAAEALHDHESWATALEAESRASAEPTRQAEVMFRAGQLWELEAGQPQRAVTCYRAVLELHPSHELAAEALTSLLTSRGDWEQLVEVLEGALEHEDDPQRVMQRLARIADLRRARLDDLAGARKTLARALQIDPGDVPLLTTMAELCRAQEDWPALADVDQRLLQLTDDRVLLKALHFELGVIWEEHLPDAARAVAQYRKVLELDASDLGALTRLSALLFCEEQWEGAARATELLLQRDNDRNRVKGYHLRLARIHSDGQGDTRAAIESCRRALALDPGDLEATELMTRLLSSTGDQRAMEAHLASTLAVHRARIDRDPFNGDSYTAVVRAFQWQQAEDPLYVVRSLLSVVHAASREDLAFCRARAEMAPALAGRAITLEEVEEVLLHADQRGPLYRLMTRAEPVLRKLHPPVEHSMPRADRITARSDETLGPLLNRLKKILGGVTLNAYYVDGGREGLAVVDSSTPALLVGREMAEELPPDELEFLVAREIAQVRLRHMLYRRLEPRELGRTIATLLSVVVQSFTPPFPAEEIEELHLKLERALSRKIRRQLEPPALELADRTIDPQRWRMAMAQSEDRLAMAACGNVAAALRAVLHDEGFNITGKLRKPEDFASVAGPRMRQLMSFAVSEEHLTLRERLGLAVALV